MIGRRGRPGLLGLAARTAVVAGTANAVSGAMNRSAQAREQQAAEAEAWRRQVSAPAAAPTEGSAPPTQVPAASTDDLISALERLAALRTQGILTDEELAQQKAKILGG